MRVATCALVVALTGCDVFFPLNTPAVPVDAAAVDTFTPDARRCFGTIGLCFSTPPKAEETFDGVTELNTDSDTRCTDEAGNGWCVIGADSIQVNGTLRGIGTKPLVLVASEIVVSGVIDVASHIGQPAGAGANSTLCFVGTSPIARCGGAGGSLAARGGNGGIQNGITSRSASGAVATELSVLRGGCRGTGGGTGDATSGGVRGDGGGALYLIGNDSIRIAGIVNASGGGGVGGPQDRAGGGGGGSGGMIWLDGPVTITTGAVFANGGGGGEGAGLPAVGLDGGEPSAPAVAAPGGELGGSGGDGGDGGIGTPGSGLIGSDTTNSGGGGGGSVGVIRVVPAQDLGPSVSPPPS